MTDTKRLLAKIDDAIAQVSYLIDYVPLSEPTPLQIIESAVADMEAQHRAELEQQRRDLQGHSDYWYATFEKSQARYHRLRDKMANVLRPGTGRHRAEPPVVG